ncbi:MULTISPECIES: AbrB/MazE/SpoVT family DNA-binding domain-containing protein [Enterococcus]|uniref:AbrB family transcriptional regulator n=1 Tax=Candidatus Enterococcus murrayae TaxID=2815321 RepID=A0ABS3HD88_9ENTE|nr:AbrB family transcriptional regulator [Enterococcus sp. MJM16]MBO0451419.1 AbrB family transcriptional regulator [Enterococcus sp. MJM16]
MGKIKVRKIGNSVGGIFPKEWGLHEGDILDVKKEGNYFILDAQEVAKKKDRALIEESFAEFKTNNTVSEEEMTTLFGKYGWGE